jgi:hypothetical protein
MQHPGWMLIALGLLICGIGIVWVFAPSIPWLGRLAGGYRAINLDISSANE